jgi:RNA polymerase sigma factor (sigma-70 family)
VAIDVDDRHFEFEAVAQKRGFQVLLCIADRRVLFNRGLLRRIQGLVSKTIHEHILIYSCNRPPKQVWQWAVRMPDGRKLRHREHPFFSGSPPASLLSRLKGFRFSLDEEADVTFVDALQRVRTALDAPPELNLFARRPWYAERSDKLAVAMAQGDEGAFHAFILLHRPLARHIAKRLQRTFGMDADDAEQIGVIGLIEAARRFNPERGTQFSTYATYWVRQACQRFGPDAALFIRLPAYFVESFLPFQRHIEKLASHGPARAKDELARLGAEDRWFLPRWMAFERAMNVRSLSHRGEPEYFEARSLQAAVEDEPLQRVLYEERVERIRAAMACLNERDRRFLRLRYGMEGGPQTLDEIGQTAGITRERVRQILLTAEKKLRTVVSRELKDLLPSRVVGVPDPQIAAQEVLPDDGQYAAPSQVGRMSNGALASSRVAVLAQEEPEITGLDL